MIQSFSDFHIVSNLGIGNSSVKKIQLKNDPYRILAAKKVNGTPEELEAEYSGAQLIQKLLHNNISRPVYIFQEQMAGDMVLCIISEIADMSLAKQIEIWRQDSVEVSSLVIKNYLYQMADGLSYCHENNVVHRDIKPENVLIYENNGIRTLKLTDFGTIKKMDTSLLKTVVGTRGYMSIEVLQGQGYGTPTDIWSLGCVSFYMCVLDPLFNNGSADPYPLIMQGATPQRLNYIRDKELMDLTSQMLCKNTVSRITACDIVHALKNYAPNNLITIIGDLQKKNTQIDKELQNQKNQMIQVLQRTNDLIQKFESVFQQQSHDSQELKLEIQKQQQEIWLLKQQNQQQFKIIQEQSQVKEPIIDNRQKECASVHKQNSTVNQTQNMTDDSKKTMQHVKRQIILDQQISPHKEPSQIQQYEVKDDMDIKKQLTKQPSTLNNISFHYVDEIGDDKQVDFDLMDLKKYQNLQNLDVYKYYGFISGKYMGQVQNGQPHGYGELTNKVGTHRGFWTGGDMCGQGYLTYSSGAQAVGSFKSSASGLKCTGYLMMPDKTKHDGVIEFGHSFATYTITLKNLTKYVYDSIVLQKK